MIKYFFAIIFLITLSLAAQEVQENDETPATEESTQTENSEKIFDIGKLIKDNPAALWSKAPSALKKSIGNSISYKWGDVLKKKLIYQSDMEALTFFGTKLKNVDFRIYNKKIQSIAFYISTGQKMDKKTYFSLVSKLKKQIQELGKFKRPKKVKRSSLCIYSWNSKQYIASLKLRYYNKKKKFSAKDIKVSIFNRIPFKAVQSAETAKDQETSEEKSKLTKAENGDSYLAIKMITEPTPEDNISTCMARIFHYYKKKPRDRSWSKIVTKLKVLSHKPREFKRVCEYIAPACAARLKRLYRDNMYDDVSGIFGFIRNYNQQARKLKKKTLSSFKIKKFKHLLNQLDEETFVATRMLDNKCKGFKDKIIKELNSGNPVLWIAVVGVIKETPPPAGVLGSTLRIIIGYNAETDEVIYTDNWSKIHAMKKLTWDKAYAMTVETFTAIPRH